EAATASRPEAIMRIFKEWANLGLGEQRSIISRLYASARIEPRGTGPRQPQWARLATRFSDWLPASFPAAGIEVRGYSLLMDTKGNARLARWILEDGSLTDPILIKQSRHQAPS